MKKTLVANIAARRFWQQKLQEEDTSSKYCMKKTLIAKTTGRSHWQQILQQEDTGSKYFMKKTQMVANIVGGI